MRSLVTGATGMIGQRLVAALGRDVAVLSRDPGAASRALPQARAFAWDGRAPVEPAALEGASVVFHLAGEPVGEGRWTEAKKARIRASRVDGTRALVASMARAAERPKVLVSASAVGYYGSRGDELLSEDSPPGEGFLPDVCRDWEAEAQAAEALGVRVVTVRIGVVLGRGGGALAKMLPLFRAGVAGRIGDGKQWMPWIHVDDVVGLLLHAAREERVRGPMNAAAPELVTNARFTRELARAVHRPALFPAPAPLLRLALGEMAGVVLASQRVVPEKALATGYRFVHPSLPEALAEAVGRRAAGAPLEVRP